MADRGKGPLLLVFFTALAGCGDKDPARQGGIIRIIGEMGKGPGQFFFPRAAAVNPKGELCVVDRSGRVQCFDSGGKLLVSWDLADQEKGQPTGINFSRSGDLLVADSHNQRILVYRAPVPGSVGAGLGGAGSGGAGTDNNTPPNNTPPNNAAPPLLRRWGGEGSGPGQFSLVRDVVEDSQGCLYAGDYNGPQDRIEKFTPDGKYLFEWGRRGSGEGEFQRPQGLAVEKLDDGREFLLVADSCNHRVQRFTTDGRYVSSFGRMGSGPGELKYPYGVAVAPRGAPGAGGVYVVEWQNNRVQLFDRDGRPRGSWGAPGHAAGELATPWDVAVGQDGRVFLVDFGNHRVQVLAPGSLGEGQG